MLTDAELASFSDKQRKDPRAVRLFQEHDYLTAYAMHTDMRVDELGLAGAVGAEKDWERHGDVQAAFLKSQGLRPDNSLLEVGCGTGRLARKIVPYLLSGRYWGTDISRKAIKAAELLSYKEGWDSKEPQFTPWMPGHIFDYVWAFSVTIHLPSDILRDLFVQICAQMHDDSRFLFSYVPEKVEQRTGLKQFRHTYALYESIADDLGMTLITIPEWPAEQKIGCMVRK